MFKGGRKTGSPVSVPLPEKNFPALAVASPGLSPLRGKEGTEGPARGL